MFKIAKMVSNNLYIYLIARINSKKNPKKQNKRGRTVTTLSYPTCLHTVLYHADRVHTAFLTSHIDLPLVFKSDCLLKFLINEG